MGAMGKEGGEVPVCRRARGYQGAAKRPLPFSETAARPDLCLCRSLQKWGAGGCPAWVLAPGGTGWLTGHSGKHLWALGTDGSARVDTAEPKLLCHCS